MFFEIKDKDLAGRIGKLRTKSGVVETPAFFPVINPFKQVKEVPPDKIFEIGFKQVITNAFIIKQNLGDKAKELGVKGVTGFKGVVMTDSGAYQLLIYGRGRIQIDPVEIVLYQKEIGSDIAVIADIPTRDDSTYDEALESVVETLRRAREVSPYIQGSDTLWVLPIQGGVYPELVAKSAREGREIEGYEMYAIGSPVTVLEKYDFKKIVEMVVTAKMNLPLSKPIHLFGGGHPLIIPLMVALGVDSFDSASYILYARDDRYMTEHGTYKLNDLSYLPCECEVCSRYTPEELMKLDKLERSKLIAIHNLHVINRELKRTKTAIKEGRLWELIEERARSHPALREAFNEFIKYVEWVERLDSRFKGDAHAIFLYDVTSYYRTELIRHRRNVLKRLKLKEGRTYVLLPGHPKEKPFRESSLLKKAFDRGLVKESDEVLIYIPFFDIIPLDIDQAYPYAQFEMPDEVDKTLIDNMFERVKKLIREIPKNSEVLIITCDSFPWSKAEVLKQVVEEVGVGNVKFAEVCVN
ncbi:MAG: hypothetical protein B7O98_01425 [Zestosphaera tikiterensis]|uniref:tRNA-guanine(15) transglycosylase n=1 Tax=Zestosphaera tikiterensis TaxID=1973259 RepID=A0A2R7Y6V8_9CREN|nr:MAG: hypothetical protein B7O98_01425 [Zestosphaera tikiterensis]